MQTRETVEAALISMYRALPGCPIIINARSVEVRSGADLTMRDDLRRPMMWGRRFCPEDVFGRHALGAWARCRAQKLSFAEHCRDMGWKQTTAEEARRRVAGRIADGLNGAERG